MSLKDWLISVTASKLNMEEKACETLINWAYEKAKGATATNSIIELSGFGKIYAAPKKIERKLENAKSRLKYLQTELIAPYQTEDSMKDFQLKIKETEDFIEYLESKNQHETKLEGDNRGQ